MSIRMTHADREDVCKKLMDKHFATADEVLANALLDLADALYNELYTPLEQEQMRALPEQWLPAQDGFHCNFNGAFLCLQFRDKEFRRVQYRHHRERLSFSKDHHLTKQAETWKAMCRALEKNKEEMREQIMGVLLSVTTHRALERLWPEAHALLPSRPDRAAKAPAVLDTHITNLNKILGL